jgi:aspartate ammonia-lyase
MSTTRIERDSIGVIEVPAERLWGAQTQRSLEHFAISCERMPEEVILALAEVKRACALVNRELGLLPEEKASAIMESAQPTALPNCSEAHAARTVKYTPTTTSILASRQTMCSPPRCTWPRAWASTASCCLH